ncbi:MAG: NUDIX hydrolase [Actinobacteria bacterium]|nr:NUDIX hydrolase [Actinomycetota bacterium]
MVEAIESIPAAGAVLWRHNEAGKIEIAVIHRPRYDDWSLPKGKVEIGESLIACAFREVLEETGVTPVFGPELGQTVYDVEGIPKVVRYWAAKASDVPYGEPNPEEVDAVEWLAPKAARKKLTLKDDKSILDFFLDFGPDTTPLILLRHAKAVKRSEWDGDDGDRPLDVYGQNQAKRLLPTYLPFAITEIHTSDAIRCMETVEPMARSLDIQTLVTADLSEYRHETHKESALDYAQELMESGKSAIICSHNPILPKLLKKLIGKKNFKELDRKLEPGEAWVLHHRNGEIVAIDWAPEPLA